MQYLILQIYKNSHIYELILKLYVNSTGFNTWFIGILTFLFSFPGLVLQIYKKSRIYVLRGTIILHRQLMKYLILQIYKISHIYTYFSQYCTTTIYTYMNSYFFLQAVALESQDFLFGICLEFVRRSEIFLVAMVILHMETKIQLNIQQICSLNIVCVA